uniref:Transposase n=1 Tax=Panagrellus redivivus TaxID=6233 RepID=A0A7E4VFK9_PANRE
MSCALPLWTLNNRLRYGRLSFQRVSRSTGLSEQIIAAVPIAESKKAPSMFVAGALPNAERNFEQLDDNVGDLFP